MRTGGCGRWYGRCGDARMTYPIGEKPPPSLRQPLRVELFFLAHSETGERLASLAAAGVALAGAVLIDELLRPVERIRVVERRVFVTSLSVSGDPVADWAVGLLAGPVTRSAFAPPRQPLPVRDAIRALAADAYERTAAGMYAGNLIVQSSHRRIMRGRRRYPPTDPNVLPRIRGRLNSTLIGSTRPDPQTDALGGLILALDLVSELYLDGSGRDVRGLLGHMVDRIGTEGPTTRLVLDETDHLIGEAAVPVYG
ncbi:GPP34 family phosphoprotein [Dactylosporangium sp. NPDC000244]|uniref:GPP34 family phosphoprotein n=1 Tax=Dactylosporangium sp. NPDC000244 TaxID=3154365 RepID=UPI00333313CD